MALVARTAPVVASTAAPGYREEPAHTPTTPPVYLSSYGPGSDGPASCAACRSGVFRPVAEASQRPPWSIPPCVRRGSATGSTACENPTCTPGSGCHHASIFASSAPMERLSSNAGSDSSTCPQKAFTACARRQPPKVTVTSAMAWDRNGTSRSPNGSGASTGSGTVPVSASIPEGTSTDKSGNSHRFARSSTVADRGSTPPAPPMPSTPSMSSR